MSRSLTFEKVGVRGLWVALIATRDGVVEVLVEGASDRPEARKVAAVSSFLARAEELTAASRRKLPLAFLYRLIRIQVNGDGEIGLQFQNRLTGSQPLVIAPPAVDAPAEAIAH